MYTNQSCSVKWDNEQSDYFKISNDVRQGGVISLLLFSCCIDILFTQYIQGEKNPVVDSDKHLENFISTNIVDRNITENVCDLYKRINWVFSDFRVYYSSTLDSLHRTYCMHMYECEL